MGRKRRPIPNKLGSKLRVVRQRLGITQSELYSKLNAANATHPAGGAHSAKADYQVAQWGVSDDNGTTAGGARGIIADYENGTRAPSLIEVQRYLQLINCNALWRTPVTFEMLVDDQLELPN